MINNTKSTIKWIGLIHVIAINESYILEGAKGAYSNAVGLGKTKKAFRNGIKKKLLSIDLKLLRLENIEPFVERIKHAEVSAEIAEISKRISVNNPVEFSTFHTYVNI